MTFYITIFKVTIMNRSLSNKLAFVFIIDLPYLNVKILGDLTD